MKRFHLNCLHTATISSMILCLTGEIEGPKRKRIIIFSSNILYQIIFEFGEMEMMIMRLLIDEYISKLLDGVRVVSHIFQK